MLDDAWIQNPNMHGVLLGQGGKLKLPSSFPALTYKLKTSLGLTSRPKNAFCQILETVLYFWTIFVELLIGFVYQSLLKHMLPFGRKSTWKEKKCASDGCQKMRRSHLAGWCVDWPVGRSIGLVVSPLVHQVVHQMASWLVNWSIGQLVGQLVSLLKKGGKQKGICHLDFQGRTLTSKKKKRKKEIQRKRKRQRERLDICQSTMPNQSWRTKTKESNQMKQCFHSASIH